ncbi:MAG: hypothetical protein QXG05_03190 [Nitrososphaerota archaeon]
MMTIEQKVRIGSILAIAGASLILAHLGLVGPLDIIGGAGPA